MEATTLSVLSVIAVFVGPIIALTGILGAQYLTNQREEKRREHERKLKRLELEEKRREQLRNERLSAYIELAESTSLVDPHIDEWEGLTTPFSKIQLVADSPELVSSAEALKDAAFLARKRAKELMKDKELGKQKLDTDEQLHQQFLEIHRQRTNFLRLARSDLAQKVPDTILPEETSTLLVTEGGPTILNPRTPYVSEAARPQRQSDTGRRSWWQRWFGA